MKSFVTYSSPNIIRMIKSRSMRWVGNVAQIGEMKGTNRNLVRKSERNKILGRTWRICDYNIKMDLEEIMWDDMDRICQYRNRNLSRAFVNTAMNPQVP
jgi:hypothetical protein